MRRPADRWARLAVAGLVPGLVYGLLRYLAAGDSLGAAALSGLIWGSGSLLIFVLFGVDRFRRPRPKDTRRDPPD